MERTRRVLITVAVVVAVVGLGACRYLTPDFSAIKTANIGYGDAINEDGVLEELLLDLYTPANDTAKNRPVIIWAHGGGFKRGDKSAATVPIEYAKRGYVTASINYRMDEDGPDIDYPLDDAELERIYWAVYDMKTAVRWFRANAASLGVDPNRIAVAGFSAGAVMALSTAVTPDDPGDSGDHLGHSSAVCTAVSIAGATLPEFVDSGDAGAVFFHGDLDPLVPISMAEAVADAMVAAGLPVEFNVREGEGHIMINVHGVEIAEQSLPWLLDHLVNAPEPCL